MKIDQNNPICVAEMGILGMITRPGYVAWMLSDVKKRPSFVK